VSGFAAFEAGMRRAPSTGSALLTGSVSDFAAFEAGMRRAPSTGSALLTGSVSGFAAFEAGMRLAPGGPLRGLLKAARWLQPWPTSHPPGLAVCNFLGWSPCLAWERRLDRGAHAGPACNERVVRCGACARVHRCAPIANTLASKWPPQTTWPPQTAGPLQTASSTACCPGHAVCPCPTPSCCCQPVQSSSSSSGAPQRRGPQARWRCAWWLTLRRPCAWWARCSAGRPQRTALRSWETGGRGCAWWRPGRAGSAPCVLGACPARMCRCGAASLAHQPLRAACVGSSAHQQRTLSTAA